MSGAGLGAMCAPVRTSHVTSVFGGAVGKADSEQGDTPTGCEQERGSSGSLHMCPPSCGLKGEKEPAVQRTGWWWCGECSGLRE